jgi:hypothetical protein
MKVKTIVEMKFNHAYTGWKGFTITDTDDNLFECHTTDDDCFAIRDLFVSKCERIEKERADEAAEAARAIAEKNAEYFNKENEDE